MVWLFPFNFSISIDKSYLKGIAFVKLIINRFSCKIIWGQIILYDFLSMMSHQSSKVIQSCGSDRCCGITKIKGLRQKRRRP